MNPKDHPLMPLATGLVALVREQKYVEAYETYFADDARSVEAFSYDSSSDPITVGKDNLLAKLAKWKGMSETLSLTVSDPSVINENQFIVQMDITTKKPDGKVTEDSEYVLYTITDGKISEERFFYIMDYTMEDDVTPIANDLYAMMQNQQYAEIYQKYYTETSRGVEAFSMNGENPVTTGQTALLAKAKQREETFETTDGYLGKASLVNGNQFIIKMGITTKNRQTGEVMSMDEYVLYTIENGKVTEERFFYTM